MNDQQWNNRNLYQQSKFRVTHNEDTDPMLHRVTLAPHWPPKRTFGEQVSRFLTNVVKKINQLLGLVLLLVTLLFLVRLFLVGIGSTHSLFSGWILFLSTPLIMPFNNILPNITYMGYLIESATVCAVVAYAVGIWILRLFFKLLVAKPL